MVEEFGMIELPFKDAEEIKVFLEWIGSKAALKAFRKSVKKKTKKGKK